MSKTFDQWVGSLPSSADDWSSIQAARAAWDAGRESAREAIDRACRIIEAADARNLATEGPVSGLPPQMTFKEWKELYDVLDKARKEKR